MDCFCSATDSLSQAAGEAMVAISVLSAAMACHTSSALAAVKRLDSMAVIALLNGLEERFGMAVDDDEIDGAIFESVGTLVAFVEHKLA